MNESKQAIVVSAHKTETTEMPKKRRFFVVTLFATRFETPEQRKSSF